MAKAKIRQRSEGAEFESLLEALSQLPPEALEGLLGGGEQPGGFGMELGREEPQYPGSPLAGDLPVDPLPGPNPPPPGPGGPGPGPGGFTGGPLGPPPPPPSAGGGSALGRMGFTSLPSADTGQFGIPVGGLMVDPGFFTQMRDHMDAWAQTDPRKRDEVLLEGDFSSVRQRLLNTPAVSPVSGLDAMLGRGRGSSIYQRTDGGR
tara:strand:- start:2314 stop:2928 length:615 start_codon:yes stop_codon:yes gene_type:complete